MAMEKNECMRRVHNFCTSKYSPCDRSQWKNWDEVYALSKLLLYDDKDGIPYIDTECKKLIIPNLFSRLCAFRKRHFSDDEYSRYYALLSKECE